MSTEQEIRSEIETLRQQIPETQALYREACVLLFFRHGITPTANKLYQYVRKGSMSAPAEALARFWDDLREKSRVRIEHPDLPETLKAAAGELVGGLWAQAQAAARADLALFRAEADDKVVAAERARDESAQDCERVQRQLDEARENAGRELAEARAATRAAAECSLQLERELVAERAASEALGRQLAEAARQRAALENALADARRDFAAELDKSRQALQRSEERHEAAEKRALLEIERERSNAARLQKELAQLRQDALDAAEAQRVEAARLHAELAELRQRLGVSQGSLAEMRVHNEALSTQLQSLRTLAGERETHNTLLQRELEQARHEAEVAGQALAGLRARLAARSGERGLRRRALAEPPKE